MSEPGPCARCNGSGSCWIALSYSDAEILFIDWFHSAVIIDHVDGSTTELVHGACDMCGGDGDDGRRGTTTQQAHAWATRVGFAWPVVEVGGAPRGACERSDERVWADAVAGTIG